ncbi:MAG: FadR/GntR family transcriptional regulator [Desulfobacteraceae bacterium]|jgi:DNA-binding FadR family transcriptional regulator|nr:FadR/GntR family transcriptional regulator [Desulfobacteraceae bacterium]
MFKAAKQTRIFQDVVEQIQETILSGKLMPGEMLPSERELKEMLQVSRGTLREALRVLEQKGLIEIKLGVGGGAVVQDISYDQINESLALLIRYQKVALCHLTEFRVGVEGRVSALAAERATPADVIHLKSLLEQARQFAENGSDFQKEFVAVDKQIHLFLAEITGNPVYLSLHHTIHDNIDQYYETFLVMKQREMEENFTDLNNIINAVERKNADEARQLAEAHVLRFNHYMENREK